MIEYNNNLYLIGFMASGKTTVGRELFNSSKIFSEILDLDREIEKQLNRKVTQIFSESGEDFFRKIETQTLSEICKKKNALISLGGGSVIKDENIRLIKSTGKVVWLKAEAKTILSRLSSSLNTEERPLINGKSESLISQMIDERNDLYDRIFDFKVDVDGKSTEEICELIIKWLNGNEYGNEI